MNSTNFRLPALTVGLAGCLLSSSLIAADLTESPPAYRPGKLLQAMLEGPLAGTEEIIFAARKSGNDHWYVNFGYYCNAPQRPGYGEGGQLCRLNLRTGRLRVLLDDPTGGVRDPQLHYDGRKILFSYRKGGTPTYHLYEINIDGSGLTPLTDGPDDDIEPTYLPDGGIMFCSSRCRRVVNCWLTRVATLYRCDGDGGNIRLVSSNNDHDNTPWVLPDGRILYMRWEYVDRSQVHFHHLWTVNPDGTNQMVFYGNQLGGIAMLDAKPIPASDKVVASFSPGHGQPEHMGYVTVVAPGAGPDLPSAARQVSDRLCRDPYAISEDCFLAVDREGIHVMDGQGRTELVFAHTRLAPGVECHEPRPLVARPLEPAIASRVQLERESGQLVLTDIYHGRAMSGIERGEIKKLLVLEQLPKPVNFSGGQEPLSIGGTFTLARVLGTVPVEPDGSAFMELPALRSLFLVALDADDLSVKRMQSFVTLQPGETTGCLGCHEQRSSAPRFQPGLLALRRPPSKITPIERVPDVLDYPRHVQPIIDRHCLRCHNPDRYDGQVDLCGDHTPVFSVSYWTITKRGLVADGRNRPYSQQAPRSIGSAASRLMQLIDGSHYGVRLDDREHDVIRLWIESGAPYAGTYASLGSGMYPVDLPVAALQRRCGGCHSAAPIERPHQHYVAYKGHFGPRRQGVPQYLAHATWQHPLVPQSRCNLDRVEKSIMLRAPLSKQAGGLALCRQEVFANTADADYQQILLAIESAAARLRQSKRFDMPGFRPNEHYLREMQRYGILPLEIAAEEPIDSYACDEAYWRSFWYRPRALSPSGDREERGLNDE